MATVNVTIAAGVGGTLSGTTTINTVNGVASFTNLKLAGTVGMSYTLRFTSPGTIQVDSAIVMVMPVISSVPSVNSPNGGIISQGNTVAITQALTNTSSMAISTSYVAELPVGLTAVSCSVPVGSCTIAAGARISMDEGMSGMNRRAMMSAQASNRTVTWTGTIPGNGSVTITYQVQVSVQANGGKQYCVTTMISGVTGQSACVTVSTPSSGPGNLLIAAGLPNQHKPGSVLIFNLYASAASTALSDSQISLTNTNPVNPINVHLFFIDGLSCTVADQTVTLTQNQTVSFMASDVDPGVAGYLIAVAVDATGCPIVANYLIGGSVVRFETGHRASLPAIGVSGLALSAPLCSSGSTTATLAFNGIAYDELPRSLAIHSLPSLATGNSPLLIVNRIGGDLTIGAERIGSLAGLLYDDSEVARSFAISGGTCQLRSLLGNNFPRTVPRYTAVIPAGRTGWMKFWTVDEQAISGAMINEAVSGLSGGYNMQMLTTTSAAILTIPVIPN